MCLRRLSLSLEYSKDEQDFIGYGYKAFNGTQHSKQALDSLGRKNYSLRNKGGYSWHEAVGSRSGIKLSSKNALESLLSSSEYAELCGQGVENKRYLPGFHIFLRQSDAEKYSEYYAYIYKVMYKQVLAFGTNETYTDGTPPGPCVVSRFMKIIQKVK